MVSIVLLWYNTKWESVDDMEFNEIQRTLEKMLSRIEELGRLL